MATSRALGERLAASDLRERAMTLDQQTKTGYQPGPPRRGRTRPVLLIVGVLAAVVVVAGVVGAVASNQDTGVVTQTLSSPSAAPPASVGPTVPAAEVERQQILAQYQRFFQMLTPLSLAAAADRPAMYRDVAVDPLYSLTLRGLMEADSRGEVLYGDIVTNPVIVSVDGPVAMIRDCQDSSTHGTQKRSDGTKVTRGVRDDLATVTMLRGPDGVWRLSRNDYADKGGCR